jgi:hypothetical protein
MNLDQFRKIYSDFRLAESRAKSDQYRAWDYSSQHSLMREPYDKKQYDPRTGKPEELYTKETKFVERQTPRAYLSHLTPTIIGGINSKLAGKDFRDTSVKFITYGEIFDHVSMIPEVIDIIKQTLNPLQAQIFVQNIDSINANSTSPGLLVSNTVLAYLKSMIGSLSSLRDSLTSNDRRFYKDILNQLEKTYMNDVLSNTPSRAVELLIRLCSQVFDLLSIKQDNFDSVDSSDALEKNATNAATDLLAQNIINTENSVRPQTQLDVRPLREIQPHLESINSQDYTEGARLLINIIGYLDAFRTMTPETPMPVLRSQATSSSKISDIRPVNTDTIRVKDKPKTTDDTDDTTPGDEEGQMYDEQGNPLQPGTATAPSTYTPQGPTNVVVNNAPQDPTVPPVVQPQPPQLPVFDEQGNQTGTRDAPPAQAQAQNQAPPVVYDEQGNPIITPARPAVVPPAIEPQVPVEDLGYLIMLPWKQQMPVIFRLPDALLDEAKLFTQYSYPTANKEGIFYINGGTKRNNIIRSLKQISQPFGNDPGLNVSVDLQFTREGLGSFSPLKAEVENELDRRLSRPRDAMGRLLRANGKPRGRGRPKRVRKEEDIESESKKSRVQPSSLSSFALPAQVSRSPDILDLHKNDIVKSITVKRSPIPQFMEDLFESLSNGTWSQLKKKHGFDSFFHLAAVINDDILIEKNSNGINVAIYKPYDSEEIKIPARLLGKFTIGEMIEKVKNEMGPEFYSYHPFENNCQNFMFRFLKDSKALTPEIAEFVSQPIDDLVKDLPSYFPPLVKAAADAYGVVQPLLNPAT